MKAFIRFFAERHLLANIITFMILLLGVYSLTQIKREMYPSVNLDELTVTTRYPGASPKDVELNVTNKIEDEIKGIDGIEKLTSYSMENISVVNISIDSDAKDKDAIYQKLKRFGFCAQQIEDQLTAIKYLELLEYRKTESIGKAAYSTQEKDKALKVLFKYCANLKTVCRMVFKGNQKSLDLITKKSNKRM